MRRKMKNKLHLHSMIVHVPCATVPLAAVAKIIELTSGNLLWDMMVQFLLWISLLSIIPSVITGIIERGHKHATWFSSFKRKLGMSIFLLMNLVFVLFYGDNMVITDISIIVIQPFLVIWTMILGIISTQGRFGGRLSYRKEKENTAEFDILTSTMEKIEDTGKKML